MSFVAQVRISAFKPLSKNFAKKFAAAAWAAEQDRTLRAQRDRSADCADLPNLTIKQLIDE